jgi:hypothetical protein
VEGQRALQASSDLMLGPTTVDGRPFFVRQMKNMKASIPVEWLSGEAFNFYAQACGALLGRAHARTGDAAADRTRSRQSGVSHQVWQGKGDRGGLAKSRTIEFQERIEV